MVLQARSSRLIRKCLGKLFITGVSFGATLCKMLKQVVVAVRLLQKKDAATYTVTKHDTKETVILSTKSTLKLGEDAQLQLYRADRQLFEQELTSEEGLSLISAESFYGSLMNYLKSADVTDVAVTFENGRALLICTQRGPTANGPAAASIASGTNSTLASQDGAATKKPRRKCKWMDHARDMIRYACRASWATIMQTLCTPTC